MAIRRSRASHRPGSAGELPTRSASSLRRPFGWSVSVVLTVAFSFAAVLGISHLPSFGLPEGASVAARAMALAVAAFPLLMLGRGGMAVRSVVRTLAGELVLAAAVFACVHAMVGRPHGIVAWFTFSAALCEEFVYRLAIPIYLAERLRRSRMNRSLAIVVSCLAAQVAFAMAHAATGPLAAADAIRLFAAGVLLSELVWSPGFWFAAALHGSFNFVLISGRAATQAPSIHVLITVSIVGLALLWMRTRGISGDQATGGVTRAHAAMERGRIRVRDPLGAMPGTRR